MAKKIVGFIKLQIPAGKANPSPPVGPALGQRGLNIMEFCKAFNAQTQGVEPGLMLPVVITAFADKSFTFVIKTPPATVLIKKAIKLEKGSGKPNSDKVGKITRAQLEEIAKMKMKDLTAADLDAAVPALRAGGRPAPGGVRGPAARRAPVGPRGRPRAGVPGRDRGRPAPGGAGVRRLPPGRHDGHPDREPPSVPERIGPGDRARGHAPALL